MHSAMILREVQSTDFFQSYLLPFTQKLFNLGKKPLLKLVIAKVNNLRQT